MNRIEDRQLIARLQARDEAAVHELAERYGPRIYQLALRQMKNREDAEEVTQDVLYKVYRKVGAFRGDSALSSWIYRITFNAAMSRLRSASHQHSSAEQAQLVSSDGEPLPVPSTSDVADWSEMADERVLRSELRQRVF